MLNQKLIKNDELLDLIDNQDTVIGQELRSQVWEKRIKNVRVINAFLVNNKNELWIPKRTAQKKIFPSCLDFSVGGFVMAGESYLQAFERETHEELNLDISQVDYSMLFALTPREHGVSSFMHIYSIRTNNAPDYNKNDFESYRWMSIDELKTAIQNGVAIKGDLKEVLSYFEVYSNSQK